MEKVKPIWFVGTCDNLLRKLQAWHVNYDKGDVFATWKYMNMQARIENIPVKRIHEIAFMKQEIDSLREFNNYYNTDRALCLEVNMICDTWAKEGKLLNGGLKSIMLALYPEHVEAIYNFVAKARREYLQGGSVEDLIQKAKKDGKDMFEL